MKIKNPIKESFDEKGKRKNKTNYLDSFMELYKSKNKIPIHEVKKILIIRK